MHPAVAAAWEKTSASWDDTAVHEALLALVVEHREFAWAAARYKEKGEDPIAQARLERLRKAATATLFATATKKPEADSSSSNKLLLWLLVMTVMLVIGLLFARIVTDRAPRRHPPVPTPTGARH